MARSRLSSVTRRVASADSRLCADWRLTPNWLPSYARVLPNRNRLPGLLDNAPEKLRERFVAGGHTCAGLVEKESVETVGGNG